MGVKSELERVLTPSSWNADTQRCFALCSSKDSSTVLYFGAEAEQETVSEDEKPQYYTYFLAPAEPSALPPSRKSALWVSKPCRGSGNLRRQVLTQLITELVTRGKRFCPHLAEDAEADPEEELRSDCDEEMVEAALVWRALWACACESGVEKGTLFLDGLGRRLDAVLGSSVVRVLGWVGAETDDETALLRAIGYLATKWLCLRSLATAGVAVPVPGKLPPAPAVAGEMHVHAYSGAVMPWLWRLRMFAPLLACTRLRLSEEKPQPATRTVGAEEAVAQYVLSHQQVELTLQLVTAVKVGAESVDVQFSLDNLRCDVARLAAGAPPAHRHVPSRIAVALWPANLKPRDVMCVSLSKSSGGAGGGGGWRMRQRRQGGRAAFEWTLYDTAGTEVWCRGAVGDCRDIGRHKLATAVAGPTSTEVVLTDDDFWHAIVWRLGRHLEGSHVIWKVHVTVVATYVGPAAAESRSVEVGHDLCTPLVSTKMTSSTIPLRFF